MSLKTFTFTLLTLAILLLPVAVIAKESTAGLSEDGLELVKKTKRGKVLAKPGTNWNAYTKIRLEKASIAFRKNWVRDQKSRTGNRPTTEGMERIKSGLSDLLDEVFRQELSKDNAYIMSDENGENVLLVTPRIVDLDVVAPDRMRNHIGFSMTDSQGSMTLELDIHDSANGALLVRMSDSRMDPYKGYMEWTTEGTNRRAARFMLIRWAIKLREWLIDASQQA